MLKLKERYPHIKRVSLPELENTGFKWVEIKNFPLYLISEYGEIYSKRGRKFIKSFASPRGYKIVKIFNGSGVKAYSVHKLVAMSFLENKNNFDTINHIDNNKINNHYSNLEWCTQKHNVRHAMDIGAMKGGPKGEGHGRTKLKDVDVLKIRSEAKDYPNKSDLARKYNISQNILYGILHRRTWSHI